MTWRFAIDGSGSELTDRMDAHPPTRTPLKGERFSFEGFDYVVTRSVIDKLNSIIWVDLELPLGDP